MTAKGSSGPRRRSRGRKSGSAYAPTPKLTLTSVPTGRAAYTDTREWLLHEHGPICAYCESVIPVRSVTLDHVTPRRGQTAYDRRDNLVLCCKACNAAKKDKPLLAFLLGKLDFSRLFAQPQVPADVVRRARDRYVDVYERLTGRQWITLDGGTGRA